MNTIWIVICESSIWSPTRFCAAFATKREAERYIANNVSTLFELDMVECDWSPVVEERVLGWEATAEGYRATDPTVEAYRHSLGPDQIDGATGDHTGVTAWAYAESKADAIRKAKKLYKEEWAKRRAKR